MKKIINKSAHLLIILLEHFLINTSIFAQAPQKMSCQAVIRNTSGALIDVNGKHIQEVYRGAHQGQETYQWLSNSVKGTYYCRITTDKKVITKPVIIQ